MSSSSQPFFKGSLITLLLMIFGMVVLGGITRLTGSGLSIVDWKPITGILPPLTLQDWVLEFQKYQGSPEFQKINMGMTLPEFQSIFWLEYLHRLLGRLLGFVLFIPTSLMIFKKQHRELWPYFLVLWILGMSQGLMGWLMVKSGLSQNPHVSPYRLSAHLFLGFAIFAIALWTTFLLYQNKLQLVRQGYSYKAIQSLKKFSFLAFAFVLLTAFWGALVAGLKAGLVYNTFPLMGDQLIPVELFTTTPGWRDLLENPVSVQFIHRLLAIVTTVFLSGIWFYQRNLLIPPKLSHAFSFIVFIVLIQFSLGLTTLLFHVPLVLAVLHQGVAFILLGSIVYTVFLLYSVTNEL